MADRPFSPSWLDRTMDAVRRLPVPAVVVYAVVGIALAAARTFVGWHDGSYPVGTVLPVHLLDGIVPLYFVAAIHYLDDLASRALDDYRAKLARDAPSLEILRYRVTTMPSVPALVLGIIGFVVGAVYLPLLLSPVDFAASRYFTSPTAIVLDTFLSALSGLFMVLFGYHTVHQLRTISRIYTRDTVVSVFDIGPLFALARVTAVTTIAMLGYCYVYIAFYTEWQINSASNVVLLAGLVLLALLTFVVPLWGAHRLLQRDKTLRVSTIGRRLEAATDRLHERADQGLYDDTIGHIDTAVEGLIRERDLVAKSKTWPWEPGALRAVATALLLPVVIWLITRILERIGI